MSTVLLLVDLQNDFLSAKGLEPPAGELVRRVGVLLEGCRRASVPVLHVRTTVSPEADDRMPHWRRAGRWQCVAGTQGHAAPEALRPRDERVLDKSFFSAFSAPDLDLVLGELGADELIVAGVHLHGCVRATVLDAYQRGFRVWVAEDGVGTYDHLHAALTRRHLEGRAATFASANTLLARLGESGGAKPDRGRGRMRRRSAAGAARLPPAHPVRLGELAAEAAAAGERWRASAAAQRAELLEQAATLLAARAAELAECVVAEVRKPIRYATAEVERGIALLRAAARLAEPLEHRTAEAEVRRVPLGTVAQITPWNNPLGIPLGKLGPALRYGNAVVWKPSPLASGVAARLIELLGEAGFPPALVSLAQGGADAATALMAEPAVHAVSLTGSSAAGYAAQAICGERRIPLQAELGGNNAAIVWRDCDLAATASAVAEAGFGAAGQRCTANRRVIVDDACYAEFVEALEAATAELGLGDPSEPGVHVGPLVSEAARERVAAVVDRARRRAEVREPSRDRAAKLVASGPYLGPALVLCDDPGAEVVQHETFGPVIVVQRATGFERALELLNGVREGLVASLFSGSAELRARFLEGAQAGVLKLDRPTVDVGVETPFGGWKSSGVGPPEHGTANLDFYTRMQAIYS